MQKPPRLTSRNLFDEIFATIPADVFLYTGPNSLREKYALIESGQAGAGSHRSAAPTSLAEESAEDSSAVVKGDEGDDLANEGVLDFNAAVHQVAGAATRQQLEAYQQQQTAENGLVHTIHIQLDTEDGAVQEAMKYASLFDDIESSQHQHRVDSVEGGREREEEGHGYGLQRQKDVGTETGTTSSKEAVQGKFPMLQNGQRQTMLKHAGGGAHNLPRQQLTTEEQIALMRPGDGRRHSGVCALFRPSKNFGFISPDIGNPDVYFTRESVQFTFTRRVLEVYFGGKHGDGPIFGDNNPLARVGTRQRQRGPKHRNSRIGTATMDVGGSREVNRSGTRDLDVFIAPSDGNQGGCVKELNTLGAHVGPGNDSKEEAVVDAPVEPVPLHTGSGPLEPNAQDAPEALTKEEEGDRDKLTEMTGDVEDEAVCEGTEGTVAEDIAAVQYAASILSPEAAQLLLLFLQVGHSMLVVGEPVTFTVHWNNNGKRSNRRLRAEAITGLPNNCHALAIEQLWFGMSFSNDAHNEREGGTGHIPRWKAAMFRPTGSDGAQVREDEQKGSGETHGGEEEFGEAPAGSEGVQRRRDDGKPCVKEEEGRVKERCEVTNNAVSPKAGDLQPTCPLVQRHRGVISVYDADEQRGHIRPASGDLQHVHFSSDGLLWAPWMEASRRCPAEGLVVNYCLICFRKGRKYTATLITAPDDTALCDTNMVWEARSVSDKDAGSSKAGNGSGGSKAEEEVERRNGPGVGGAGSGSNREENTQGRKRARDEEMLLLEEDDYGIM
uniref:WGS project CAEQ00000000 data, annotated contig 1227 n=1 Tax=Trypanosoma congolense (strain IL3000) TaxID=1068625 RepID=F9W4T9_TRYCI|nr:unnamed protein product [Trypanosoma congolense IL3000]